MIAYRRNTPIQSRKARNGFTPLPGQQTTAHPGEYTVPLRTHTVMAGQEYGSYAVNAQGDPRGGNG